jgi:alpha-N-arabinofuranosidase
METERMSATEFSRRAFLRGAGVLGLGVLGQRVSVGIVPAVQQASEPPRHAHILVDPQQRLGAIDRNIYGNFIEHLGRCVYGGVFDEGSRLADSDGLRKDVLAAVQGLGVTQLRWPGGNFSSDYHWMDGIGPRDQRPARYDLAWFERESNHYGTDEFMVTCRKLGAEPYLCVNTSTGTLDEAARWVEYCNHSGGTYISDLRKKYGHPEPYRVKYWGLGNEMWGDWQIGHKDAADYAKVAVEFAKVMKWEDPSIKLIACGNGDPKWDQPVLAALAPHVDYISAHHYSNVEELKDYYEILGSIAGMEVLIRDSAATAAKASLDARRAVPIWTALDEWNLVYGWSDGGKRDDPHKFEIPFNLRDALWVAAALNCIQRHCQTVRMANLAQLVNVAAPIYTTPTGLVLRTIYYPLALYAQRSGPVALDVTVDSPRFATRGFGDRPYLDVSATYDEARHKLSLAVVNLRKEGEVVAEVELNGLRAQPGGRAFLITGDNPDVQNTIDTPRAVSTKEVKLELAGSRFEYRFPRHSVTWLEFSTTEHS